MDYRRKLKEIHTFSRIVHTSELVLDDDANDEA